MKKTKKQILDDIINNLKHFFNETDTSNLQSMLYGEGSKIRSTENVGEVPSHLLGSHSEGSSLRFEIDRLLTFAESGLNRNTYQKLCLELAETLTYKGEYEIAEEIIEGTFSKSEELDTATLANINLLKAKIVWNFSDWESSKLFCKKAFKNYSQLNNIKGMSSCENILGNICGETGDLVNAEKHYRKGLELVENSEHEDLKAMLNVNLGIIADMRGKSEDADRYYKTALKIYKKLDNEFQQARLEHNLGMLYLKKGDYKTATVYFDNSINLSLINRHHSNYSLSLIGKATCYFRQNLFDLANKYADKAFEIAFGINDRLTIAEVYRLKGLIQKETKNYRLAEEYLQMSIRINENFSNKYNSIEASVDLSKIYNELNRKEQSIKLEDKAAEYYKEQDIKIDPESNNK